MKNMSVLRMTALALGLMLTASGAYALPVLQVYIEGATYDSGSESWVLAGDGSTARLWVIAAVGDNGPVEDVHLAVAYDSVYSPTIVLMPAAGTADRYGFSDESVAAAVTSDGVTVGGTPTLSDGSSLPSHGVYGDTISWEQFNLGNFTETDSQMADFTTGYPGFFDAEGGKIKWGQINVYDISVSGDGLDGLSLHFDVYNHIAGETSSVFAPFSHDATYLPPTEVFEPVPEPFSMVMLGCVGAGMFAARRMRNRKK